MNIFRRKRSKKYSNKEDTEETNIVFEDFEPEDQYKNEKYEEMTNVNNRDVEICGLDNVRNNFSAYRNVEKSDAREKYIDNIFNVMNIAM